MRYAVAFVVEKDQPVSRPMWVAAGARANVNFGSYRGPSFKVTDQPEQAATYAKRETAERWAENLSCVMADGEVVYKYEAVEAPENGESA